MQWAKVMWSIGVNPTALKSPKESNFPPLSGCSKVIVDWLDSLSRFIDNFLLEFWWRVSYSYSYSSYRDLQADKLPVPSR